MSEGKMTKEMHPYGCNCCEFNWSSEHIAALKELSSKFGKEYIATDNKVKVFQAFMDYNQLVFKSSRPHSFTFDVFKDKLEEVLKQRFYGNDVYSA